MRQFGIRTIALISLWLGVASCGFSAEIILDNGSKLSGTIRKQTGVSSIRVVELDGGGVISVPSNQISKITYPKPEQLHYDAFYPKAADTVEAQMKLADWCRDNGLHTVRKVHLARVVELDPNQATARRALGQVYIDGQWWNSRDDHQIAQGKIKVPGKGWKLPQELEIEQSRENVDRAQKNWYKQIQQWREWLDDERSMQAQDKFRNISDPLAVDALIRMLGGEKLRPVRILLVQALANIPAGSANQELARLAIVDEDEEIRLTCLDYLQDKTDPNVISYFVGQLQSKDNRLVNRAGAALRIMRDMTTVGPLVEAVVTTHKYKVIKQGGDNAMSFNSAGGFGMGGGPKYITRQLKNIEVLNALIELTGQNFSFDQTAWKHWYSLAIKNQTLPGGQWLR